MPWLAGTSEWVKPFPRVLPVILVEGVGNSYPQFLTTTKPNFNHMPKATKKKAGKKRGRKPGSKNKAALPPGYTALEIENPLSEILQIETNPPPLSRGDKFKTVVMVERIKKTLKLVKPGQAFIINGYKSTSGIRKLLTEHFPEHLFVCSMVSPDSNAVRVYYNR